jgi:cytochrome c-type biogenesis protein CcmH
MMMLRSVVPVLTVLSLLAACRDAPRPAPPREVSPSAAPKLPPLTSRDGAPAQAPVAEASQTLPSGHPPIDGSAPASPQGESGPPVSGSVDVAPALKDRSGAALFIVARDAASGQIVAVRKEEARRFPVAFRISGADAMMAGTAFTGPFDLTARLSRSGDAIPASGDLEGTAKGVSAGASNVKITLDSVRP